MRDLLPTDQISMGPIQESKYFLAGTQLFTLIYQSTVCPRRPVKIHIDAQSVHK